MHSIMHTAAGEQAIIGLCLLNPNLYICLMHDVNSCITQLVSMIQVIEVIQVTVENY